MHSYSKYYDCGILFRIFMTHDVINKLYREFQRCTYVYIRYILMEKDYTWLGLWQGSDGLL